MCSVHAGLREEPERDPEETQVYTVATRTHYIIVVSHLVHVFSCPIYLIGEPFFFEMTVLGFVLFLSGASLSDLWDSLSDRN